MITQGEFVRRFKVIEIFINDMDRMRELARVITGERGGCEFGSGLLAAYIELLSSAVGDQNGWVSWYIWENDMGKKRGKVKINDQLISVSNPKQLYKVIAKTNEAGG